MADLKVSIITAVYNSKKTIADAITSVLLQTCKNIEHIIIDGGSTDGTLEVVNKFRDRIARIVSEPHDGIYNALNKGIKLATGDIVGILHADDIYADERVIEEAVNAFSIDSVYGDLIYVKRNKTDEIVRY